MSPSLHTYKVGTVILPAGLARNIARYQLRAAVNAPGSLIAATSRAALAALCPPASREAAIAVVDPSRRSRSRSGMRGNWKKNMYHDARTCLLVHIALSEWDGMRHRDR